MWIPLTSSGYNQGETQLKRLTRNTSRRILNFIRQIIYLSANTFLLLKTSQFLTRKSGRRILNVIGQGRISPAFGGKADVFSCPGYTVRRMYLGGVKPFHIVYFNMPVKIPRYTNMQYYLGISDQPE